MTPRLPGILALCVLIGCGGGGAGDDKGTGADDEDTGGGGSADLWRASGEGTAFFLDGVEDNSLFHLEMTRAPEPREGEAYYGFVSRGGEDPVALGQIPVTGEDVIFEADIGENAVIGGYDTFEAWANATGTRGDGDPLWAGQVDPVIYGVIQNLVIASTDTPSGEGSLRAVESLLQELTQAAQGVIDATGDVDAANAQAESISNAISGAENDWDDDGTVNVYGDDLPIVADDVGYVDLILADLAEASGQVDPGHPVKDLADYAYDNIQAMEEHALNAATDAGSASILTTEELVDERLADVILALGFALDGTDLDEDGAVECRVDDPRYTEGTIECALQYVAQMAQMDVSTP